MLIRQNGTAKTLHRPEMHGDRLPGQHPLARPRLPANVEMVAEV
jgi:hypothetical protein